MRTVRRSCAALLSFAALVACLSSAHAEIIPGSQRKVQGWSLAAYDAKGRSFNHCGISVGYRNGIALHFILFANRAWSIAWTRESWNFSVGQSVPLAVQVDGGETYNVTGIARSPTFVIAEMPTHSPLYDMVRRGNQMSVQTAGSGRIGFSLDGTSVGLSELAACVDRFTQVAQNAPSPTAPVPRSPATTEKVDPAVASAVIINVAAGPQCELLKRALSGGDAVIDGPKLMPVTSPDVKWPGIGEDGVSYSAGEGRYIVGYHISDDTQPSNRADAVYALLLDQVPKCLPAAKTREEFGKHYFCAPGTKKIVSVARMSGLGRNRWSEVHFYVGPPLTFKGPMRDGC